MLAIARRFRYKQKVEPEPVGNVMAQRNPEEYPRLRPVEPFLLEHQGERMIGLRDPSGLSQYSLTISPTVYTVLTLFTGDRSLEEIQAAYALQFGQFIGKEDIRSIIQKLDAALYMESPRFEGYVRDLQDAYRTAEVRPTREAWTFGCGESPLAEYLDEILGDGHSPPESSSDGRPLVGIVAPHLDYPRGKPCYGPAYRMLRQQCRASRFVVVGTNHFGRSGSAVATAKDFDTPLGIVPVDRQFLDDLCRECDADLYENELDHLREHSVELQAVWLRHLFTDRDISIIPILCPDPCGPTGTAPRDGRGVDLRRLARALRVVIDRDPTPTCIVAGADLSHVGTSFGDERLLDDEFLTQVERRDRLVLKKLVGRDPDAFLAEVAEQGNQTRICSAGCLYTLAAALSDADAGVLGYHQAVDRETQTCVTCTAVALHGPC